MKVLITPDKSKPIARIDFNRDIPSFMLQPMGARAPQRPRNDYLFSRGDDSNQTAGKMAAENTGRLPVEFSTSPVKVYRELLNDLALVEGLVGICESCRYSITIRSGQLFEVEQVAEATARVIHSVLYPREELEVDLKKKRIRKQSTPRPTKSPPPKTVNKKTG